MTNDGSRREGSGSGNAAATAPENARHPQRRLVTVTPAGRRRHVEILANYLLRNRRQRLADPHPFLLSAKSAAGRVRWKWYRNTSKLKRFLDRSRSQVATALRGRAA